MINTNRAFAVIVFALLLLTVQLPAQVGKLMPVDEADQDSSFLAFRSELIEAVRGQDTTYLLDIIDPRILNSFGGDGGVEEFRTMWFSSGPETSLWDTLEEILNHGGCYSEYRGEPTFMAPYYSCRESDVLDPYEHVIALDDSVAVHENPSSTSSVLIHLSYDIVPYDYDRHCETEQFVDSSITWNPVLLKSGLSGWVDEREIGSAIGYRAVFVHRDGSWRMNALVAGD